MLFRVPSPICLGSVSPSPYKVARRKSPTEPGTAPTTRSLPRKHSDTFLSGHQSVRAPLHRGGGRIPGVEK
jgi:hypothetical protein